MNVSQNICIVRCMRHVSGTTSCRERRLDGVPVLCPTTNFQQSSYPIASTHSPEFTPVYYMLLVSCSVLLALDQRVVKQADD